MQADNVTRILLAAILVCLAILVGQSLSRGSAEKDPAPAAASAGRFAVHGVALKRGPSVLLRLDTATGQVWKMGIMDAGRWDPLAEGPDGIPAPGASEPDRYSIRAITQKRGSPTLVRTDHHTGRIWRKGSTSDGPWVLVPNPLGELAPEGAAAP